MEIHFETGIPGRKSSTYKTRQLEKMVHAGSVEECQNPGMER